MSTLPDATTMPAAPAAVPAQSLTAGNGSNIMSQGGSVTLNVYLQPTQGGVAPVLVQPGGAAVPVQPVIAAPVVSAGPVSSAAAQEKPATVAPAVTAVEPSPAKPAPRPATRSAKPKPAATCPEVPSVLPNPEPEKKEAKPQPSAFSRTSESNGMGGYQVIDDEGGAVSIFQSGGGVTVYMSDDDETIFTRSGEHGFKRTEKETSSKAGLPHTKEYKSSAEGGVDGIYTLRGEICDDRKNDCVAATNAVVDHATAHRLQDFFAQHPALRDKIRQERPALPLVQLGDRSATLDDVLAIVPRFRIAAPDEPGKVVEKLEPVSVTANAAGSLIGGGVDVDPAQQKEAIATMRRDFMKQLMGK